MHPKIWKSKVIIQKQLIVCGPLWGQMRAQFNYIVDELKSLIKVTSLWRTMAPKTVQIQNPGIKGPPCPNIQKPCYRILVCDPVNRRKISNKCGTRKIRIQDIINEYDKLIRDLSCKEVMQPPSVEVVSVLSS